MKINSIKIKGLFDKDFDVYIKADSMTNSCDSIFCNACDLSSVIDFLFLAKQDIFAHDGTAECVFEYGDVTYHLSRTKSFDNLASLLREHLGDTTKRYTQVDEKLRQLFKTDLQKLFDGIVIESSEFDAFNQNPAISINKNIAEFDRVAKQTQQAYDVALDRKNQLKLQIKSVISRQVKPVKPADLENLRQQTASLQKEYIDCLSQIATLKDQLRTLNTRENLQRDIDVTKDHIKRLDENSSFIEEKRTQLAEHDKIQQFLPQLKEILSYKKQLAETKQLAEADSEELEWLRSERKSLNKQLDELSEEITRKVEQNTRLLLIRNDNESIESISRRNDELADRILELQGEKEQLDTIRDTHKKAIDSLDASIEEAKDKLKAVDVPVRSINDLIENVRTSVRIKEVEKQLETIDNEIALVSAQIGDRELDVKKLQENVNLLVKIDGIVTPFKSKDTILQILQSKINKSELILQSLTDKQNNLREEIQNLHYKEIEIDQSAECLQTILSQKQFDRDIVLKKQAISEQQALPLANGGTAIMVMPTSCAFIDEHIESIKSDLVRRNNKKLEIVSRQAGLKCVLSEVERQRQIVLGDIISCRNERDAITKRFRELTRTGNNEIINKYFQALDIGKATSFVMEAQRGLVETQTQVGLLKEKHETLIRQKKDVSARLATLSEVQKAIDLKQMTVEMMVESNEETKSLLVDLTEKLMLLHTQRKAESDGLESVDIRISNLNTLLNEVMNEKKANEKELLKINQKVSLFAKGDPEEAQQVTQEKVNELMSEKRMLEESKADIDNKILAKTIEVERSEILLSTLLESYENKKESAQSLMKDLGDDDIESIKLKNLSDEDYQNILSTVQKFDVTLSTLKSRLQNLEDLYDQNQDAEKQAQTEKEIAGLEQQCEEIKVALEDSKQQLAKITDDYILSDKMRYDLANLLQQYNDNKSLDTILKQNKVIKIVVEQEISKILTSASRIYSTLCGSGEIVCLDGKFAIKNDCITTPFDQLSLSDKLCLFLSIKLCDLQIRFPQCKTVLLHGDISLNKEEMTSRLANLKNRNFVTEAMSVELA